MQRFRANARFGPWRAGDEFESEDELHLQLAASSSILTEIGATKEATEAVELPVDEAPWGASPADASSEVEESSVQDELPWPT